MREIKENIYKFDELSQEAKNKVREKSYWILDDPDADKSMVAIGDVLGVSGYDVSGSYDCYRFYPNVAGWDNDIMALSGVRALAYIVNNFITPSEKGKYYSTGGHYDDKGQYSYKYRYSKATKVFNCSFTGYYIDDSLMIAFDAFIDNLRTDKSITVYDYIKMVYESAAVVISDDNAYKLSDDGLKEYFNVNGIEFYADGTQYTGAE